MRFWEASKHVLYWIIKAMWYGLQRMFLMSQFCSSYHAYLFLKIIKEAKKRTFWMILIWFNTITIHSMKHKDKRQQRNIYLIWCNDKERQQLNQQQQHSKCVKTNEIFFEKKFYKQRKKPMFTYK